MKNKMFMFILRVIIFLTVMLISYFVIKDIRRDLGIPGGEGESAQASQIYESDADIYLF